jgi:hypothetical protein
LGIFWEYGKKLSFFKSLFLVMNIGKGALLIGIWGQSERKKAETRHCFTISLADLIQILALCGLGSNGGKSKKPITDLK